MILFLITLSVISSLAIQLLVKIGWKKSTYETKMCEILARDIKIYTHITLAVVIRLFLYIYLSVQGDINMYMRINSICSNQTVFTYKNCAIIVVLCIIQSAWLFFVISQLEHKKDSLSTHADITKLQHSKHLVQRELSFLQHGKACLCKFTIPSENIFSNLFLLLFMKISFVLFTIMYVKNNSNLLLFVWYMFVFSFAIFCFFCPRACNWENAPSLRDH